MRPSAEEGVKIVVVWGRVDGKGVAIGRVYARVTEGEQVKQGDEVTKRLNVRCTKQIKNSTIIRLPTAHVFVERAEYRAA